MASPVARVVLIGGVALMVIIGGAGLAYYWAGRRADPSVSRSQVATTPVTSVSLPGDRMLPDTQGAYTDFEDQRRAAAERQEGAAAAVAAIDTLEPSGSVEPPDRPPASDRWTPPPQNPEQARERGEMLKKKSQGMGKLLATWGGVHTTTNATLETPTPLRNETESMAFNDPLAHLVVDQVYYGLLRVYISSDEPGPVVVSVKEGDLNGARLIGGFKRADEKVVIHFDRMTFKGAWYTVDAYAIDPDTGRLGLATDVDRRTFTRWAALLGSAVLQGAQRAYLSQGTQSSYLWGQTTTHDFDDREILGIALGEIGTRTRQTANDYFNRPPTVYVDPAIQLVGVLFMGPPSRKTQGASAERAALNPSPPTPTATGDYVRAVKTATRMGREYPSENTTNLAREPAFAPAVSLQVPGRASKTMDAPPSLETVALLITQAARRFHVLFEYLGFMIGFILVGIGSYQLYSSTKDPYRGRWSATFHLLAGVSLVYLNQWYRSASLTFLGLDETLIYAPATSDWSTLMMGACLAIIQLLGLVALLRCWFLVRLVGSGDLGRFALARAAVFFVAGVLALNILQTARVVFATLGTTSPLG